MDRVYTRDGIGNITGFSVASPGAAQTFGYDLLSRLTGASGGYGSLSWTYDGAGNRLSADDGTVTAYAYTSGTNRLASTSGGVTNAFSHNARGDMTAMNAFGFGYDLSKRLTGVTLSSTPLASYVYDYRFRRVKKAVTGGDTLVFAHDRSSNILTELEPCSTNCDVGTNLMSLRDYVYLGAERIAQLDRITLPGATLTDTFESFEGAVSLDGYIDPRLAEGRQDQAPDAWSVVADVGGGDGANALELTGNTWKTLQIAPVSLGATSELHFAMNALARGEVQGVGVGDGAGRQMLYVKQGTASLGEDYVIERDKNVDALATWATYDEPVGADWEALYGDYPVIRELYVVNENDASSGVVRFDALSITNVLAVTVTESAASVSETFATCPTLASWTDPRVGENPQDTAPSAACSAGALGLADNTWKTFSIGSVGLTSATYMRVVMGIATAAELQGFGVQAASDDTTLLLVPEENELNDVRWVHTLSNRHQPTGVSRIYDVALGRLWQAVHGPSGPTSVQHVVLANDDDTPPYGGAVSFDEVSIYDRVETIPSLLPTPATRARYFVNDHLGTPVALTDADGDVIWSTERDPWGGRHGVTGATGVVQPFDMPGQYYDQESGLSQNWWRYYASNLGRYVQSDPAAFEWHDFVSSSGAVTLPMFGLRENEILTDGEHVVSGEDGYAYARGNPIKLIDFVGLQTGDSCHNVVLQFVSGACSSKEAIDDCVKHVEPGDYPAGYKLRRAYCRGGATVCEYCKPDDVPRCHQE